MWDNCHQYSLTGVRLSFSIFADYSFFKSCGSDAERALTRATFFVAAANVIYRTQINLLLVCARVRLLPYPMPTSSLSMASCPRSSAPGRLPHGTCCSFACRTRKKSRS